jgi:hypothetical protein
MKFPFLLALALVTTFSFSCKKEKAEPEDDGTTRVTTLEVDHTPADGIYGEKYTFKLRFEEVGNITEYGIVYKPWIGDETQKNPVLNEEGTFKIPFGEEPQAPGTVETKEFTMRYADFNDANYRAYAVTANGNVIYGDILYITFTD